MLFAFRLVLPHSPKDSTSDPTLPGLLPRLVILAAVFASELGVISILLDTATLTREGALTRLAAVWGAWVLRSIVGFVTLFMTFAYLKCRPAVERVSSQVAHIPIRWGFLAAHAFTLLTFGLASAALYGNRALAVAADLTAVTWFLSGILAIAFAGFAFMPGRLWLEVVRRTGNLWVYAGIAAVLACVVGNTGRSLWQPATQLTFELVKWCLRPFAAGIIADPQTMVVGTPRFSVTIAPECSGFEGAGLILAFGASWIWLFRHECRFPQALLLIPAGVTLIFLLNALRIALLILIGNAGAVRTALGGFHSQAGWIGFNAVALSFSIAAGRVPWLTKSQQGREVEQRSDNPTAAYLMPLLMMLGAGMISTAAASELEWLYPLRFFAAAGTLWAFRRKYASLDWRFGWHAPAIGGLVFGLWVALGSFQNAAAGGWPAALAAAPPALRLTWILFRIAAPVLTVPLVEELAFRGFLLRRLVSAEFESISFGSVTWFALLASSLVFGLLHGGRWLAGSTAGVLYGLALTRRGRIGDPVVAHATTNALLAIYVLASQKWDVW